MSAAWGSELRSARRIDERWDFDDPEGSEAAFCALLEQPEIGGDSSFALQVRTQIARAEGLQRKFAEAHATLDRVEAELREETPLARVRLLLERGRVLNSSGAGDSAESLFLDAWTQAQSGGADFYAIDAAHMLAIIAQPDDALAWNERALAAATSAVDERARGWAGSLCNNIGWTHHAMGRFDDALAMFERALEARTEEGVAKKIRVARWCVARCLRSLGRHEEALAQQQAIHEESAVAGEEDGYNEEEIAECLLALGRSGEARPHFVRAYECLARDPWFVESESERLMRLKELAGAGSD